MEQQGQEEQSWALSALQFSFRSRLLRSQLRERERERGLPGKPRHHTRAAGPPPALPASSPPWHTPPRAVHGAPEGSGRRRLRWPLPAFPANPGTVLPRADPVGQGIYCYVPQGVPRPTLVPRVHSQALVNPSRAPTMRQVPAACCTALQAEAAVQLAACPEVRSTPGRRQGGTAEEGSAPAGAKGAGPVP